jgi:hypothetical protein
VKILGNMAIRKSLSKCHSGLGMFVAATLKPMTYYKVDTANMFLSLVHCAVVEVIDSMIQEKGLRALSEDDKKPIMKDFFTK